MKLTPGQAVVYSHPDGGSVSATVQLTPRNGAVVLSFAVPYRGVWLARVSKTDRFRITPFPKGAMFFCAE